MGEICLLQRTRGIYIRETGAKSKSSITNIIKRLVTPDMGNDKAVILITVMPHQEGGSLEVIFGQDTTTVA